MLPRIGELFKDRSVFVTGASGFLGKVLVEKLLYSVPDIKHVYVIIRSSRGVSPQERWNSITEGILFERLRKNRPESLEKVIVLEGDLIQENLGMHQHDIQLICDEVSIVFHCAATVKFDEKLREAVEMNLRGTTRLVSLCHKMNKLACLVHCSTAYANCDRKQTEEIVYPAPVNPQKLMEAIEWMDDDMLEQITSRLLGQRPNTYTLTKALAESQLMEDAKGLPVIIFRPSIVTAMWKEQLPGWIDNVNGPTGLLTAVGKGVLSDMCGDYDSIADLVPVDVVANMMVACAAYRMTLAGHQIPVMHCTSGHLNPLNWKFVLSYMEQMYRTYPMEQGFGVVSTNFHKSPLMFELNHRLMHEYPAMALDAVCKTVGKKAVYSRIYAKIRVCIHTLEFFTTRGWHFDCKGLPLLWEMLDPEDRKIFNFDIRQVDWSSYLFDYAMGAKKYILKEKIDDNHILAKSRANLKRMERMRFLGRVILCYAFARLIAGKNNTMRQWVYFALSFGATQAYANLSYRPAHKLKTLQQYLEQQKS